MDTSLLPKGNAEVMGGEPSDYLTASECQSGGCIATTNGKEGST